MARLQLFRSASQGRTIAGIQKIAYYALARFEPQRGLKDEADPLGVGFDLIFTQGWKL